MIYFEFPGEKLFPRRSHFRGEAIFKKTLLPLPCKECSKSFSESGSLKTHLTVIEEKSHLFVKNVPNQSHSPVPCSLFHKRKSVVPFKDSKDSNPISTFSLLHLFGIVLFCLQICLLVCFDCWGNHWPQSYREYLKWEKKTCSAPNLILRSQTMSIEFIYIIPLLVNNLVEKTLI